MSRKGCVVVSSGCSVNPGALIGVAHLERDLRTLMYALFTVHLYIKCWAPTFALSQKSKCGVISIFQVPRLAPDLSGTSPPGLGEVQLGTDCQMLEPKNSTLYPGANIDKKWQLG